MRTYIFTPRERTILKKWLEGAEVSSLDLARLKYYFKTFKQLPKDISLYLKVAEKWKVKP